MTATKHLIVYLELPIMVEQLTPLSAIGDLHVSAEMGTKQIWKEVDIQISSLTNLSQGEQACLLKVSVWQVHLGHLLPVSILSSAQTQALGLS